MDYEAILTSVKKTNRLVVLEEAWPFGSVASEITYMVQERAFDYFGCSYSAHHHSGHTSALLT